MGKKKAIILLIILVLLIICMFISVSYGYYVISSNEKVEMPTATSTPSCIGLTISNSTTFSLEKNYAVPITDEQFINSSITTRNKFKYTFTVSSDCTESRSLNIGIAPLDGSVLDITKLKYALVDSGAAITSDKIKSFKAGDVKNLSEDMKKYLKEKVKLDAKTTYNIEKVTLTSKATKTYDLYMWISSAAGNEVMDQSFKAIVVLDDVS